MQPAPSAGEEWRSNWPVVMAAMLGMSFYATVNYSFDQFAAPVEQAFGLSREDALMLFRQSQHRSGAAA